MASTPMHTVSSPGPPTDQPLQLIRPPRGRSGVVALRSILVSLLQSAAGSRMAGRPGGTPVIG
jgi:hypothetical protein